MARTADQLATEKALAAKYAAGTITPDERVQFADALEVPV
jgi:hypothetical protein